MTVGSEALFGSRAGARPSASRDGLQAERDAIFSETAALRARVAALEAELLLARGQVWGRGGDEWEGDVRVRRRPLMRSRKNCSTSW